MSTNYDKVLEMFGVHVADTLNAAELITPDLQPMTDEDLQPTHYRLTWHSRYYQKRREKVYQMRGVALREFLNLQKGKNSDGTPLDPKLIGCVLTPVEIFK